MIEDEILAPLSARERGTLHELLSRVLANADQPAVDAQRTAIAAA
jgi:hypothetical protein